MKKHNLVLKFIRNFNSLFLFFVLSLGVSHAQNFEFIDRLKNDGGQYSVPANGQYQDLKIPEFTSKAYLNFVLKGGDGGKAKGVGFFGAGKFTKGGGEGATVSIQVAIGEGAGQVPPGAIVRFMPGKAGVNRTSKSATYFACGGGGGGTGIAFKGQDANDQWVLLAVAGGGTGAVCNSTDGHSGDPGLGIYTTVVSASSGKGGTSAKSTCTSLASGGGGAFSNGEKAYSGTLFGETPCSISGGYAGWPDGPDAGEPAGGEGVHGGGWGFGGGGGNRDEASGSQTRGGGGGGYRGGEVGAEDSEGGWSFYNGSYAVGTYKKNSTTKSPADGYVQYQFTDEVMVQKTIRLLNDQSKCIDLQANKVTNSQNIQLYDCSGSTAQNWAFDGLEVKLAANGTYCLDLKRKETANGTNIQLYECNGGTNQQWVYDGMDRAIRPVMDLSKCVYADKSATDNGTNIQLYDCHYYEGQQWTVDGAATPDLSTTIKTIRPATATTQCLDLYNNNASNGTNIQLWHCNETEAQNWIFDGLEIKLARNEAKCLDLAMSQTTNGTNIRLYSCNGSTNQQWIYDGMSQSIRSVLDPNKCLDMANRWTADGTNVQLYDCKEGETAQQWIIE